MALDLFQLWLGLFLANLLIGFGYAWQEKARAAPRANAVGLEVMEAVDRSFYQAVALGLAYLVLST